ncbi:MULTISPECIES: TrlF family AAA-like ATPase [unclassified Rhodococcus (in: high G+C Gram-positive bacteria)]|uniref:TrlF family AAA-like ATPase n=1 Tax=unclassified Rhodococcus (in: high G+C Gram-positive bacteria) TaxID=192944 RepID=UPI0032D594CA
MPVPAVRRASGTEWRIWDLHIHTPASIVNGYGGNSEDVWARFIDELESLPADVGVVGINDYWFLDGYERVLEARKAGRLANLDAVFPVVELRLDQFGGTDGDLSRVNLHVIFDPAISPEVIRAQFLYALQSKAKLSLDAAVPTWQGVITRESLQDLGKSIKKTVPDHRLGDYGSDLIEGFNNINVSFDAVQVALDTSYFRGRTLLGIGKTEWADIKWNDQSIAAKKNVINSADLIFTAFKNISDWAPNVAKLRSDNVNHRLLDCSDAHNFSDSKESMRLGACLTWMNTSPTFAGLSYALKEFDRRVFVGLEPASLSRVRKNPERFISSFAVKSDDPDQQIFSHDIDLNSGFVAVVGNKGQGKSALLDCIALAGNSSRSNEFAFLNSSRFLSSKNLKIAQSYYAQVQWATTVKRRVGLAEGCDRSAPISVEYLPQAFVERVCNAGPTAGESDEFEDELRTILFTHIGEDERAGENTFSELLQQKTRTSQEDIDRLRSGLREHVGTYANLARFRSSHELSDLESRIALKEGEVMAARETVASDQKALTAMDSTRGEDNKVEQLRAHAVEIEQTRSRLVQRLNENEQRQAALRNSLSSMETVSRQARNLVSDTARLNVEAESVMGNSVARPYVQVVVDDSLYEEWRDAESNSLQGVQAEHEDLAAEIVENDRQRSVNAGDLASADSARERARQRILQSEERLQALLGSEIDQDSLYGLQALRNRIADAPSQMVEAREKLIEQSKLIHESLVDQLLGVEGMYAPASRFIRESEIVRNVGLEFQAELRVLPSWYEMSSSLDGRRNGDHPDWLNALPQRIEDTGWAQISFQLPEILDRLEAERGEASATFRHPESALRSNVELEDFLISIFDLAWLEVRFGLTGDGVPLSQLSPGQRGLLLALFYLVVDQRSTPLLLDQPEENLDNATIASKLVPAIHEAAGRRQTIVVTHNANLAIVGDADQIILCEAENGKFTISSGSIAELDVARFALDVLEGTKTAFDNRRHKYEAFPELV